MTRGKLRGTRKFLQFYGCWKCPGCGMELWDPQAIQDHRERCEKFKRRFESTKRRNGWRALESKSSVADVDLLRELGARSGG